MRSATVSLSEIPQDVKKFAIIDQQNEAKNEFFRLQLL
jgi:hypothetical protein